MFLDNDILVGFIRGEMPAKAKINELRNRGELLQISVITACELWQGVFLSKNIPTNAKIIQDLLSNFNLVEFNEEDVIQFGQIFAQLQKAGKMIGLITHNISHFERIPLLKIEDWK